VAGCRSKGVIEPSGVPAVNDHPQVVASLVLKETVTLSVPGASRLLEGARFVMEKAVEAAAAIAGANISSKLDRIARIN
jgi:hypothetical protein